jgi:FtsP/CotA-like multicopper oxidase with cupredoxin domain
VQLALAQAVDRNPDPRIVEIDLDAHVAPASIIPGTETQVWTYDGTLPGPLIRANVGDRVIAHFTNHLSEPTTIHWHGLRIPAAMDGAPGHSQPEVAPGASFTYDFTVPDAALFWYHPHVNSSAQVTNGLYAPFLVTDPADPLRDTDELVLVLSDIYVRAQGELGDPYASGDLGALFGREGTEMLVNGRIRPTLTVRPGRLLRLRLVNTARSRYFQLLLAGHSFRRIGGDGGLLEYPVDSETVVLAPAERADVLLVPRGEPGNVLPIRWRAYDRGWGTTYGRPDEDLLYLSFAEPAPQVDALPTTSRAILPLDSSAATDVTLRMTQQSGQGQPLELGFNEMAFAHAAPVHAAVGETQIWTLTNTIDFSHPFHLHGFFFQVLGPDGAPVRPLEWKDTVDVPVDATRRLIVRYDDRPGMWMFHCHLLDHAEVGMMGVLQVTGETPPMHAAHAPSGHSPAQP